MIHPPEKWTLPNATEARRLVMKMLDKQKDSQVKRDSWRRGWRVAVKQDPENKENKKTPSHKTSSINNYEEPVNLTDKERKERNERKDN